MSKQEIKTRKAYRQGELLFIPLDGEDLAKIDFRTKADSYWKNLKTNVLRECEATGHKHEVMTQTLNVAGIPVPTSRDE
jgi:hypothetical protein